MKTGIIVDFLLNKFPLSLADDFDNGKLGLVLGSKNIEITNILYTLDLNLEVVEEAISKKCNLIIAHHPYFFIPITKINYDSEQGQVVRKMMDNQISLFCMHTNFDVSDDGVNDTLTKLLKLKDVEIINGDVDKGNYLRYGMLSEPLSLNDLIELVKTNYQLDGVRYVGKLTKKIKKVGVIGGAGGGSNDIMHAINAGCDCYISGEFRLSSGQMAKSYGLCLIEVPHGVEKLSMYPLMEIIDENFGIRGIISDIQTDPFKNSK